MKPRRRPHASGRDTNLIAGFGALALPAGDAKRMLSILPRLVLLRNARETQSRDRCVALFAPDDNPAIFTCLCAIGAMGLCIAQ
jgi:hypothetical protein